MGVTDRVRPGQILKGLPADSWNGLMEVLRAYRAGNLGGGGGNGGAGGSGVTISVKNASGADVDRFGILGIDDIVFTPTDNLDGFKNGPVLSCITPADPDHLNKFAVLLQPVADDAIGLAKLAGPCVVKVDVASESDAFATILDGDATKLQSGGAGVPILYKESGTGEKWAIVLLGGGGAGGWLRVQVIAQEAGDGIYEVAEYQTASAAVDPAAAFTSSVLGTLVTTGGRASMVGLNLLEMDVAGHYIDAARTPVFWGRISDLSSTDDRTVVEFWGILPKDCTGA
jgi:hypothetical protein